MSIEHHLRAINNYQSIEGCKDYINNSISQDELSALWDNRLAFTQKFSEQQFAKCLLPAQAFTLIKHFHENNYPNDLETFVQHISIEQMAKIFVLDGDPHGAVYVKTHEPLWRKTFEVYGKYLDYEQSATLSALINNKPEICYYNAFTCYATSFPDSMYSRQPKESGIAASQPVSFFQAQANKQRVEITTPHSHSNGASENNLQRIDLENNSESVENYSVKIRFGLFKALWALILAFLQKLCCCYPENEDISPAVRLSPA